MSAEDKTISKRSYRLDKAMEAFDAVHRTDTVTVFAASGSTPKSLHYHQRLSCWVEQLSEEPSEPLRLAARCQHLRRWAIPRDSFPRDRAGYREWRRTLAEFHVREASAILRKVGYDEATIDRVEELLLKRRLRLDPEVQLFEDAICLVFLECELAEFLKKHNELKVERVLRKTWKKMSLRGREAACVLAAELPREIQILLGIIAQ